MNISNISAAASAQVASSTNLQQSVAVAANAQDHDRAEGKAAVQLIDSASLAQTTGKGGQVDVTA